MAMRSTDRAAPLAGSVTKVAKPRQRQTPLVVVGVLLVAACALGAVLLSRSSARRVDVLVAARELFAARGLEATLNDVAHHANVGVSGAARFS